MMRIFKKKSQKFFCISMQRTGTTSVGQFFKDHGFFWAGWPADEKNHWFQSWMDGDFEAIFDSKDFKKANAFEDSPWWSPGFYRILFHRFPGARFILFERDNDAWFKSMVSHSQGDIIGGTSGHCKVYRRELEYWDLVERGILDPIVEENIKAAKTMKLIGMESHYKNVYQLHNREVKAFFSQHNPNVLFTANLEDRDKWVKLGDFLGVKVRPDYNAHNNKSL